MGRLLGSEVDVFEDGWQGSAEDTEMRGIRKLAQAVVLRAIADMYPQQVRVAGITSESGQRDVSKKAAKFIFGEEDEDEVQSFEWWCQLAKFNPQYLRRNLRIISKALYLQQKSAVRAAKFLARVQRSEAADAFREWGHTPRMRVCYRYHSNKRD